MSIVNINSFSYSDVKDRSVLKVVHLNNNNNNNNNKTQVAFKQPESDEISIYVPFTSRPTLASEITYQRLSRLGRVPSTTSVPSTASRNGSIEDKSTSSTPDSSQTSSNTSSSRSLSEPRRRIGNNETATSIVNNQPSANSNLTGQEIDFNTFPYIYIIAPKSIISSPRSGSTTPTTPRFGDDDAR
jgi:hypothetical protein